MRGEGGGGVDAVYLLSLEKHGQESTVGCAFSRETINKCPYRKQACHPLVAVLLVWFWCLGLFYAWYAPF